jgi:hypothetical protein
MLTAVVQSNAVHTQFSFFLLLEPNDIVILIGLHPLRVIASKYWDISVDKATGYGLDGQG